MCFPPVPPGSHLHRVREGDSLLSELQTSRILTLAQQALGNRLFALAGELKADCDVAAAQGRRAGAGPAFALLSRVPGSALCVQI